MKALGAMLTSRDLRCAEVGNVSEVCNIRVRGARRLRGCGRGTSGAEAASYEFLAAPQINLSLVYRLDKLTGDVIACQFAHNPGRSDVGPGAFGVTNCYRGGDGATKQEPSDYGLYATRHEQEGGVFRVDYRTGALSICYLDFQARSRAITRRSRTSMSYARPSGSSQPPRMPAARSVNCRRQPTTLRRETDALSYRGRRPIRGSWPGLARPSTFSPRRNRS